MRSFLSLAALFLLAGVLPGQTWRPALARSDTAAACERPAPHLGLQFGLQFGLRDRLPPAPPLDRDREIREILYQWPNVLRRLERLEWEVRGGPRADPRGELCPRCPPPDLYAPRVDPYAPPYLPPAAANPLGGYQRYQGVGTVRR